jgi:hypothetical protein
MILNQRAANPDHNSAGMVALKRNAEKPAFGDTTKG